jgi:Tfp pilus assembly protein PilO
MLALAMTVVAVAILWLGAISPALGWYAERAEYLAQQQTLAARMASVAGSAASLQQRLAAANAAAPESAAMLAGATDSVAGANLQQAVQDIATRAGATVLSAEMLPATAAGSYRRIGVHLSVSGSWPQLTRLMATALQATPRMLIDDVQLHQTLALGAQDAHPMQASLTVIAFSPGQQAAR